MYVYNIHIFMYITLYVRRTWLACLACMPYMTEMRCLSCLPFMPCLLCITSSRMDVDDHGLWRTCLSISTKKTMISIISRQRCRWNSTCTNHNTLTPKHAYAYICLLLVCIASLTYMPYSTHAFFALNAWLILLENADMLILLANFDNVREYQHTYVKHCHQFMTSNFASN